MCLFMFSSRYGTTSFMMPRLISVTAGHFDTKFDLEQVSRNIDTARPPDKSAYWKINFLI